MLWLKRWLPGSQTNPASSETVVQLGRSLPALLDEAVKTSPNAIAFNDWVDNQWRSYSNHEVKARVDQLAQGWLQLGLTQGDRVAFLLRSDLTFCLVDLSCLQAGLVDVPIDLTQTVENMLFVLRHSQAKALVVATAEILTHLVGYLTDVPSLQWLVVVQGLEPESASALAAAITPSESSPQVISLAKVEEKGNNLNAEHRTQKEGQKKKNRRFDPHPPIHPSTHPPIHPQPSNSTHPQELATIIYIPNELGHLQGVMLTHENLSANALTAFAGLPSLRRGRRERGLSVLPLTHVFARSLLYGHIAYGHSIYFSTPQRVMKHLQEVRPTIMATVPLLLEKAYGKLRVQGAKLRFRPARWLFRWALAQADRYGEGQSLGQSQSCWRKLRARAALSLADQLVLRRWRSAFGGRLRYLLTGGAPLSLALTQRLLAARLPVLQGYGLTQTSAVVCYNRGRWTRVGTVGKPMAGAEIRLAADGEILIRGPYVTPGYYRDPIATQTAIDAEGWFHTGDLGRFSADGFLTITGLKKALFKLSTGKYIAPLLLEQRVEASPLVERAIIVGAERKFCGLLLIPNTAALHHYAQNLGLHLDTLALFNHPCIQQLYATIVEAANCHVPYWGAIKTFRLLHAHLSEANGLLDTKGALRRSQILQTFATEIDALYGETPSENTHNEPVLSTPDIDLELATVAVACGVPEAIACPVWARSLHPRLTG